MLFNLISRSSHHCPQIYGWSCESLQSINNWLYSYPSCLTQGSNIRAGKRSSYVVRCGTDCCITCWMSWGTVYNEVWRVVLKNWRLTALRTSCTTCLLIKWHQQIPLWNVDCRVTVIIKWSSLLVIICIKRRITHSKCVYTTSQGMKTWRLLSTGQLVPLIYNLPSKITCVYLGGNWKVCF